MAVRKTVSFMGPYIGRTFQELASALVGRDGYLGGAAASDDGANVRVSPYSFMQRGIVCTEDGETTLPAPAASQPWYVIAATVDDDPATGVILAATADVGQLGDAVVLAYKTNGIWSNPRPITAAGVLEADAPEPGREAGFVTTPVVAGGTVAGFALHRGRAVDAEGHRREIAAQVGAEVQTFPAPGPNLIFFRNDHLILRQRESGSEVVHAIGDTIGPRAVFSGSIESGPLVSRPSVFTKRGAGDFRYALAWGNGTGLRLASAIDLSAMGSPAGVIGPLTAYTGAAPIANVWIAGQRAADGALLIVFTEGAHVFVVAVSVADGSIANAPVQIDSQPNTCTHVRAALDQDGLLHVVYQHDEGGAPPNQQVYYAKCSVEGGRFGIPAVSPRLANLVNSTRNDTWPSVGVDRQRRAQIAYTTGTGANDFGQLRIIVLDASGGVLQKTTYARFGHEPDVTSADGIVDGSATVDYVARPLVVVTPHDEVSVFFSVKRVDYGQPDQVGVFHAGFEDRLGFPLLILSGFFAPSGAGTDTLVALAALADERGQLQLLSNWSKAGLLLGRLDTVIAPLGILAESYLESSIQPIAALGNTDPELALVPGSVGGLMYALLNGEAATLGFGVGRASGRGPSPHPNDVYLSGWEVDADTTSTAPARPTETAVQAFHTRPKKMSYPILVGDEGDYQGYGSLEDALFVANRNGGHVVVRGGSYLAASTLVLRSGVQLEGEGHALISFPWDGGVQLGTFAAPVACTIAGIVVTVAGLALRSMIRPGDLCEFFSSTGESTFLATVWRILDDQRFVVDAVPTGATVMVYASSVALRNFTVRGKGASIVLAQGLYGARIENIKPTGFVNVSPGGGLRMTYCRESLARDVDVTGMSGANGTAGIWLDHGTDNVVERAALGDSDGRYLQVEATTLNPRILHCGSPSAAPARIHVDPRGTNPVLMSGCTARIDGDLGNIVTPVGKVLSAAIGRAGTPAGAMQFQDENTVLFQAGVPLDLTAPSAAGTIFNGATPRVLVPSVNERLLRAGDTMTGELGLSTMAFSEVADPAIPPQGTVRLYLRSNGQAPGQVPPKHRSQLVMLMPDGNALVIAQTDPN